MHLIDIGVNLTSDRFNKDRPAVIERALGAGVKQMILTGTNLAESEQAAELAAEHAGILFSTAGIHPHDAKRAEPGHFNQLKTLTALPQVVAVGECGLDFNRDFSPRPTQAQVFEQQLGLATELAMPAFMHCRDAHDRFTAMVREFRDNLPGGVLHCFTADKKALWQALDLDLHIGITGWICDERRGDHLRELVRHIPANRLLLETDAPYLLPRDVKPKPKGGRNEPALLAHIAKTVAACRGEAVEGLAQQCLENTRQLFNLQST